MPVKAIIVEDELNSREVLKKMLVRYCPEIELSGEADDVSTALKIIHDSDPELIFLDIEMSGESGFDLLDKLKKPCSVIFTTAYDKYALRAIKFSALDYLLKPIDSEELIQAVKKATGKQNNNEEKLKFLLDTLSKRSEYPNRISLPTGTAYEIVNINDIIRCESDGHYTTFILADKRKLLVSVSMKYYEEILPEDSFVRVHHSHLININHVVRFLKTDGGYAIMSDNSQVEISRRKKEFFLQRLQKIS